MGEQQARLSATETAARLGVKPETLYAYVSRGLLARRRGPHGSSFDPLEVERFAASRRRSGTRTPVLIKDGRPSGGPLMTIDTDVALIEDGELYYRGRSAAELAGTASYEAVCRWLWADIPIADGGAVFRSRPEIVTAVVQVLRALDDRASYGDRIRIAVQVIGGQDPLREDRSPASVAHRAGSMIIDLVLALGSAEPEPGVGVAAGLVSALGGDHDQLAGVVNTALVLLVDHDLAVSTLAARAAASARANPYAVVTSGLGALDSPLHGSASLAAYRLLAAVLDGESADQALARASAAGRGGIPGFGHRIYLTADPRAEMILELLADKPDAAPVLAAVDRIVAVMADRTGGFPNVDLALAALAHAGGLPDESGSVIFAVARMGGWIAHALDEYGRAPLRLRPIGRYIGP